MQNEEQRARAELEEAMGREGHARKALEAKLAERTQQLQAAQKAEAAGRQEGESRAERIKALERQLQVEVEKRTQADARGDDLRRQLEEYQGAHDQVSTVLQTERHQAAQLEAALGGEEEKRRGVEQKLQAVAKELEQARAAEEKARAQAMQVAAQVQKLQDSLKAESQKSSSLREQLNAQLAGGSEATIRKLTEEMERLRADTMALRKVREELADANRKAIESQASLTKERREREALAGRIAELERRPPAPAPAPPAAKASGDEVEKLRADVAKLKAKLVAAENAAEGAALLRSKVARLEAQLKKKG
jgi:chromosome segregation ATPase